jgi:hypothetical protein
MKRRLLFMILLIIVLAILLKYGVNAAPRFSDLPLSPAYPTLTHASANLIPLTYS